MEAEVWAIHEKQMDRARKDDNAWFRANPDREYRVRDIIPYELNEPIEAPPPGMTWRTIVVKLWEGVRVRQPTTLPAFLKNEEADDQSLALIFNRVAPCAVLETISALRSELSKLEPDDGPAVHAVAGHGDNAHHCYPMDSPPAK